MRKHILFFEKRERIQVYKLHFEMKELHAEILTCNCYEQVCRGKYIKAHDYQDGCLWSRVKKEEMLKQVKYQVIMPNTEFPLWGEYEKFFDLNENTIFTYNNVIYTSHELPDHLLEHEKVHIIQQNTIGCDNWVSQYLRDKAFRLKQEVEAYRLQLSVVKDKNARLRLKNQIIKAMASPMYGSMTTEEEATTLLKE